MENQLETVVRQEVKNGGLVRAPPQRLKVRGAVRPGDLPREYYERLKERVTDLMRRAYLLPTSGTNVAMLSPVPTLDAGPHKASVTYNYGKRYTSILLVSPPYAYILLGDLRGEVNSDLERARRDAEIWEKHLKVFWNIYELDRLDRKLTGKKMLPKFPDFMPVSAARLLSKEIETREHPIDIGVDGRVEGLMTI